MALVDRGVMPDGIAIEGLLAIAGRCPECPACDCRRSGPGAGRSQCSGLHYGRLGCEPDGFLRRYAQARDVAAADVIRELIRQVRADPDLSARVTAELERRREALAEAMRAPGSSSPECRC